jgi:uncharacterized protein (DUF1501 family)
MKIETSRRGFLASSAALALPTLPAVAAAAKAGVTVVNRSDKENLVMLKHFGPGNPDAASMVLPKYK